MKNKFKIITTFAMLLVFLVAACTARAQTLNSAEALKEYLDKQPANSPDKPIKVTMNANAPMMKKIAMAINSAGKYVSLNLSGNTLITIPDYAFFDEDEGIGCDTLTAITIPDSVTSIGKCAFQDCSSLASVTIPNSVTRIGPSAFSGCASLASVTIPDSIEEIDRFTFSSCASLANVIIPNSVTNIEVGAFVACASLTNITIPNNVTRIWNRTFEDCIGLASVIIGTGVTSINSEAFSGCSSLVSIIIPNSVTRIGESAFESCTGLTSVKFESTISSDNFTVDYLGSPPFPGDLRTKYLAGGIGTYTRPKGGNTWTKQ